MRRTITRTVTTVTTTWTITWGNELRLGELPEQEMPAPDEGEKSLQPQAGDAPRSEAHRRPKRKLRRRSKQA